MVYDCIAHVRTSHNIIIDNRFHCWRVLLRVHDDYPGECFRYVFVQFQIDTFPVMPTTYATWIVYVLHIVSALHVCAYCSPSTSFALIKQPSAGAIFPPRWHCWASHSRNFRHDLNDLMQKWRMRMRVESKSQRVLCDSMWQQFEYFNDDKPLRPRRVMDRCLYA